MNKSNFVHVATFGAAIGLKGEIKVNLLTSTIDVFRSLDQYYNFDQSIKWSFESIVMRQEKCVALPSHCKNRDDAEELKNQKIFSFKESQSFIALRFFLFHLFWNYFRKKKTLKKGVL